jgi:putative ABC transport system substrate-binding protein
MTHFIHRHSFLTLLGTSAAAWPLAARAQQPRPPVIGYVSARAAAPSAHLVAAFRQGLAENGFVEGRNVAVEYRWADERFDRLPALAADLVRRQVSVIAATGASPSALAAKAATATIPIVFQVGGDPVAYGLVASLGRPGGNLTGVTSLAGELAPKRLELLHEAVPTAKTLAALYHSVDPSADLLATSLQPAGEMLGLAILPVPVATEADFNVAFESLARMRAGGLVIVASPLFTGRTEQLAGLALRHGMPAIYQYREFVAAGGLMSYGPADIRDSHRLVGRYVSRILKGEKVADLPVQQATKIELIINMRTAKALGLTFPITLLGRADEVIE